MSTNRVSTGPVDLFVLSFPGSHFTGRILPAIGELVEGGIVRIIDILLAMKDADGEVRIFELQDLPVELFEGLDPVVEELTGLLTADDVEQFSALLEPGSSLALLLFENSWARRVGDAIEAADGRVLMFERIPRPVMQDLIEERERLLAEAG